MSIRNIKSTPEGKKPGNSLPRTRAQGEDAPQLSARNKPTEAEKSWATQSARKKDADQEKSAQSTEPQTQTTRSENPNRRSAPTILLQDIAAQGGSPSTQAASKKPVGGMRVLPPTPASTLSLRPGASSPRPGEKDHSCGFEADASSKRNSPPQPLPRSATRAGPQSQTPVPKPYQGEQRVVSPRGVQFSSVYWEARQAVTEADSHTEGSETDEHASNTSARPASPTHAPVGSLIDIVEPTDGIVLKQALDAHASALDKLGIKILLGQCLENFEKTFRAQPGKLAECWTDTGYVVEFDQKAFLKVVELSNALWPDPALPVEDLSFVVKALIMLLGKPCANRLAKHFTTLEETFTL